MSEFMNIYPNEDGAGQNIGNGAYYIVRTWDVDGNEKEDVWERPQAEQSVVEYIIESRDGSTYSILGKSACELYDNPRWMDQ